VSSTSLALTSATFPEPGPVPRQWSTVFLRVSGLAVVCSIFYGPLWYRQPLVATASLLLTTTLICTGVILQEEAGHRWTATLLLLAGVLWSIGWLEEWGGGPLPIVSELASPIAVALTAWAMFRYPDPDLVDRRERIFLWALTIWIIGGQAVTDAVSRPEWADWPADSWWLAIHPDRLLEHRVSRVVHAGEISLACAFVVLWGLRFRRVRGLDRRMLAPMAVAAPAAGIAGGAVPLAQLLQLTGGSLEGIYTLQPALLAVVPASFLASVVRQRLASTAVVGLVRQVQSSPTPESVQESLQQTLDDRSLRVCYWAPELHSYVDMTGTPVEPLSGRSERLVIPISSVSGQPLAVIDTDPVLRRHSQVVEGAVSASGLVLENAQLQAAVLAQVAQVRAARLQAVRAGVAERRRLERDLHDGAQQRLLALRLTLAAADDPNLRPAARDFLRSISAEIAEVLGELRELARGIHPAVLSQAGLAAAVEAVIERHPIAVDAYLPSGRFPAATEETAYFMICEALDSAVQDAADQVLIRGHEIDGILTIEIEDDGKRPAEVKLGAGLEGLIDRIRALGGDVMFSNLAEGGSLMVAAIPCA
jgi:signal transduction histidine kinase